MNEYTNILEEKERNLVTYTLLVLTDLCKKFNIKDAYAAITFFKQYYSHKSRS
jgi:hypothetical protein